MSRHSSIGFHHAGVAGLALALGLLGGCSRGPRGFENDNDRLRRENSELKAKVDELSRNIDLRLAEIKRLEAQSATQPAVEGAEVPRVVEIKFDHYSGAIDTDSDGTDDALRVYLKTIDQRGRFLVAAGRAVLQVVAITPGQPVATLIEKTFTPAELDAAYRSGLTGTHYTLETPLPRPLPAGVGEVTVKVTFTDAAGGVTISHEEPVKLRRK
ncbi:MAG: hypothetical protein K8S99_13985 [Planctomycetes bacterium]|nr:hypothetical protein [Planctomycetota bacterium]